MKDQRRNERALLQIQQLRDVTLIENTTVYKHMQLDFEVKKRK